VAIASNSNPNQMLFSLYFGYIINFHKIGNLNNVKLKIGNLIIMGWSYGSVQSVKYTVIKMERTPPHFTTVKTFGKKLFPWREMCLSIEEGITYNFPLRI
jgi:hypothetical protein